jgi:putative ABC transport system ATP-binding protein
MPLILQTERLSRIVQGKTLVDQVSMEVAPGEVVAITGPSGSGKSSFLRLLNRLDEPTSGRVLLEGQDYTTVPPAVLRRRVGMVLQTPHLLPGTVADNVCYGPRQHGETIPMEAIAHLLEQVGLPGYAHRDVGTLSGGEAQRVSFIRTLANRPQVLLLDEPTSALDSDTQQHIERLVCEAVEQQQMACIIITHNQEQAARMAHRTLMLVQGRIQAATPREEHPHA